HLVGALARVGAVGVAGLRVLELPRKGDDGHVRLLCSGGGRKGGYARPRPGLCGGDAQAALAGGCGEVGPQPDADGRGAGDRVVAEAPDGALVDDVVVGPRRDHDVGRGGVAVVDVGPEDVGPEGAAGEGTDRVLRTDR